MFWLLSVMALDMVDEVVVNAKVVHASARIFQYHDIKEEENERSKTT